MSRALESIYSLINTDQTELELLLKERSASLFCRMFPTLLTFAAVGCFSVAFLRCSTLILRNYSALNFKWEFRVSFLLLPSMVLSCLKFKFVGSCMWNHDCGWSSCVASYTAGSPRSPTWDSASPLESPEGERLSLLDTWCFKVQATLIFVKFLDSYLWCSVCACLQQLPFRILFLCWCLDFVCWRLPFFCHCHWNLKDDFSGTPSYFLTITHLP